MKTLLSTGRGTLFALILLAGTALAERTSDRTPRSGEKFEERTVFVTGSLIPQRIRLHPIGTTTQSPIRIIDRREIDQTGRHTTPGALVNEPSLRILGH
jgi:hypothetical protein